MGQGLEPLERGTPSGDDQPRCDGGSPGDVVVALEDEGFDGLEVEDAVELGMKLLDHVVEAAPSAEVS